MPALFSFGQNAALRTRRCKPATVNSSPQSSCLPIWMKFMPWFSRRWRSVVVGATKP